MVENKTIDEISCIFYIFDIENIKLYFHWSENTTFLGNS